MTSIWAYAVVSGHWRLQRFCEGYFWLVRLWHKKWKILSDIRHDRIPVRSVDG